MANANLWLGIAVLRGLESERSAKDRLLKDPVSLRLLPTPWRLLLRLLTLSRLTRAILARRERQVPGVMGSLLCRTRFIDDALVDAMEAGTEQVVILGAGFDTRAYRIAGMDAVRVFELDHPVAQTAKRKALDRASIAPPTNVTFVPVDLEDDDLAHALASAGFRSGLRTFFISEGVTQYISRRAVEDTLKVAGGAGGTGSRLVFSYIREDVIEGRAATAVDRKVMAQAARGGAPWTTGLDPDDLPFLLQRYGLRVLEEVGEDEYRIRYLEPLGRPLHTLSAERVVLADTVEVE